MIVKLSKLSEYKKLDFPMSISIISNWLISVYVRVTAPPSHLNCYKSDWL